MKTPKLRLVKLGRQHLEKLRLWRMQPGVTEYLFTDPLITKEEQQQWYTDKVWRDSSFHWIITFGGIDIGYVTICDVDMQSNQGTLNIFIGEREYRGRGIGSKVIRFVTRYAFNVVLLHKLRAIVFTKNHPAIMSYLSNGWEIEGLLRDHAFKHDVFHDVYVIAKINKMEVS